MSDGSNDVEDGDDEGSELSQDRVANGREESLLGGAKATRARARIKDHGCRGQVGAGIGRFGVALCDKST